MVKRDYWFIFLNGLLWFAIIGSFVFALFGLWLLFSPSLWSDWSLLAILVKVLIVLAGIVLLLRTWDALKDHPLKEMARLERLRMTWQDTPVLKPHTEPDAKNFTLPIVLTRRMSAKAYLLATLLPFFVLGVIFVIVNVIVQVTSSSGAAVWLDLPVFLAFVAVVVGIIGLALYQRIEVTERALLVQRGIVRHKIAWERAILFALISENGGYELSSKRKIARWSQKAGVFVTYPIEKYIYQHLMGAMLVYIQHRTDLPLRDLR